MSAARTKQRHRWRRLRLTDELAGNSVGLVSSSGGAIGVGYHSSNPALGIAGAISRALDPALAPGKVRTLADMAPEERAKMIALYGRKK